MTVNLSAKFTEDEKPRDGLVAIEKDLIEEPLTRRTIIATVETARIVEDILKGTTTPTVRLVHVEVVDGEMQTDVQQMLKERFRARTGRDDAQEPLPFDDAKPREHDVWLDDKAED